MKQKPGASTWASLQGGLLLLLCLSFGAVGLAAERRTPPPTPQQAGRDVRQVTGELNQSAGNLRSGATAQAGMNQLQRLARETAKVKSQAEKAKKAGDDAVKAAEKAKEAAMKAARECNEKNKRDAEGLMAEAQNKISNAQREQKRTEDMAKDLQDRGQKAVDDTNKKIRDLQNKADAAVKAATDAGLKESDWSVDNVRKAQEALRRETANQQSEGTKEKDYKDEGSLHKLEKAQGELNRQLSKIKADNNPSESLGKADQLLKEAGRYLDDCPPRVGAVPQVATTPQVAVAPQQPVDVFVAVDNRPWVNICIPPGKEPEEVINALGLGESQLVTINFNGTMIRAPGDAATIAKIAKEKGIDLCFVESDYCMIMTPLTPFRGHDHKAHVQSGREPHEHDGPDPPWNWGVKPPETVIRWEASR